MLKKHVFTVSYSNESRRFVPLFSGLDLGIRPLFEPFDLQCQFKGELILKRTVLFVEQLDPIVLLLTCCQHVHGRFSLCDVVRLPTYFVICTFVISCRAFFLLFVSEIGCRFFY